MSKLNRPTGLGAAAMVAGWRSTRDRGGPVRHRVRSCAYALVTALMVSVAPDIQAESGHELTVGLLVHDLGIFSNRELSGTAVNLEWTAPRPRLLRPLGGPRPILGIDVPTTETGIHVAYTGLEWRWGFTPRDALQAAWGAAVHDGDLDKPAQAGPQHGVRYLGCRVLFYLALGWQHRLTDAFSLEAHIHHSSNADRCSDNQGLENAGLRGTVHF